MGKALTVMFIGLPPVPNPFRFTPLAFSTSALCYSSTMPPRIAPTRGTNPPSRGGRGRGSGAGRGGAVAAQGIAGEFLHAFVKLLS